MDWRYNTIWFDQLDPKRIFKQDFKESSIGLNTFGQAEYAVLWNFKCKGLSFDLLPKSDNLLYLEMNSANLVDFLGIDKYQNLKRLELHYCIKLETDSGISKLTNLEFFHINQSKKLKLTSELLQLKKLKVLRFNSCGALDNIDFINLFPNLIDFRFVNTNVLSGDLTPILKHPNLRTVGFSDKKHFNYTSKQIKAELTAKSEKEYKEYIYKGEYRTFKYKSEEL